MKLFVIFVKKKLGQRLNALSTINRF